MRPKFLAGGRIWLFAGLLANGLVQGLAALAFALAVRSCIDGVGGLAGSTGMTGWPAIAALVLLPFLLGGLRMHERVAAERLGQEYIHELRLSLFQRLMQGRRGEPGQRRQGAVMLRFVGDLNALRNWISIGLARLAVSSLTALLVLVALALVDLRLATAVSIVVGCGAAISLALGKPMYRAVREARRRRGRLAAGIGEQIAGTTVIQVCGQERRERRRLRRASRRLVASLIGRARVAGSLRATSEITGAFATGAVVILGISGSGPERMTPGMIAAALVIVGLLVPRLLELNRVWEYWTAAHVSSQRIDEFLRLPAGLRPASGNARLELSGGRIDFENVSVAGALEGITASAAAGSVIAVTGPNGAGKSTLLSLVAGLADPDSGRILIDGQDIRECLLADLRQAVSMAGPDLPLLSGSVLRNVRYRAPRATDDDVARVLEFCSADRMVAGLPDGLATRIREGGANLSLGQRQSIVLARALVGDPGILLLDETGAHLDPLAARAIDRVVAAFPGTVLMVTHSAERARSADTIWHIEDGALVACGPTQTLLRRPGPVFRFFSPGELAA